MTATGMQFLRGSDIGAEIVATEKKTERLRAMRLASRKIEDAPNE